MLPTTVPDFCKQALTRILVTSGDASPKIRPSELQNAINEYNLIADSWGADGNMAYAMQTFTFALTPGKQTYTIGANTAADMNTGNQPRPSYIEFASYQVTSTYPVSDLPMEVLSAAEYQSIVNKGVTSGVGYYAYLDGAFPIGNLSIYPVPQIAANVVLTTWQCLNSQVSDRGDVISLPPAYARALSLDLSIAMAPYYGKSGTAAVMQLASQLGGLRRLIGEVNARGSNMRYSSDAQGAGASGTYDVLSDRIL